MYMEKKAKRDKASPHSAKPGRPPKDPGTVRAAKAICYLLPAEAPIVEQAARVRSMSVSDTLRAGLRSLGVQLIDEKYRIPAHD